LRKGETIVVRLHKLSRVLLGATLVVGLTACGGDNKGTSAGGGATTTSAGAAGTCGNLAVAKVDGFKPVKSDTLTVVTSLPGPGFWVGSSTDPNEIKAGYEYCMAKAVQEAFGLKNLTVRNESFDAIVAGTVTDYDLALSQSSITDDRKKVVDFTDAYFESQQGVLVKGDSTLKVSTVDDAKKLKWGVQTGTTANDMLKDLIKPSSEPLVYQQLADAYAALDAGQVDAVLIDTAINLGQAASSSGKEKVIAQFAQPSGPDEYGGILPKGSTNTQAINTVLKELKDGGVLTALANSQLTADPGNLPTIQLS
jgi:polar amino acid transport system substrate-binding protein